ncbi:hypothetical protein ACWG8W_07270 [Citricoccus zhacaiensis]
MGAYEIDPVGLGAVMLNADVHVQNLRDDNTMTTALSSAESAAKDVSVVVQALSSFEANLAIPAKDNIMGLCEGRLVATQTLVDAYVEASAEQGENARISSEAIDAARDSLDRDQYGAVDLNEL